MSELSNSLREKRKKAGLKVSEVVKKLATRGISISEKTIYNWETGFRTPDADEFICLCEIYDVQSFSEFNEKEKSPEPEGSEEQISMDESNRLFDALVNAGLIDDSMNFSEADGAFFNGIAQLINAWVMSHRR